MQFRITQSQTPGLLAFNYDELKTEIARRVEHYKTLVYSEGEAKNAKADKSQLNALKKSLNDERIRLEKEWMSGFQDFKSKVNEIITIIDEPIAIIDKQLDEFEKIRRKKKTEEIEAWFEEFKKSNSVPEIIEQISDIWNEKWMNATFTMKQIEAEVKERLAGIQNDINVINGLASCSFEAMEAYKDGLDLRKALAEAQRQSELQAKKEAAKITADMVRGSQTAQEAENLSFDVPTENESSKVEKPENGAQRVTGTVKTWWVDFRVCLTAAQAHELKAFFEERNIPYEAKKEN